jgi:hypothetical protein
MSTEAERPGLLGAHLAQASSTKYSARVIETLDLLTDAERQAGRWEYESQPDSGTYYVMLRASPDFDLCWNDDQGAYDPSCADGLSSVLPLVVPQPAPRYAASAKVVRFLKRVDAHEPRERGRSSKPARRDREGCCGPTRSTPESLTGPPESQQAESATSHCGIHVQRE